MIYKIEYDTNEDAQMVMILKIRKYHMCII